MSPPSVRYGVRQLSRFSTEADIRLNTMLVENVQKEKLKEVDAKDKASRPRTYNIQTHKRSTSLRASPDDMPSFRWLWAFNERVTESGVDDGKTRRLGIPSREHWTHSTPKKKLQQAAQDAKKHTTAGIR
jgi:hypothetical protein